MNHVGEGHSETAQTADGSSSGRRWRRPVTAALAVAALALSWSGYSHWRRLAMAEEAARDTANFRPSLHVVVAQKSDDAVPLSLPGDTSAFEQARIFARATGYLAERDADIGSRVHAGDRLARIAAPDLDAQLAQANATLAQRQAALRQAKAEVEQVQSKTDFARVTDGRFSALAKKGWESQQLADQSRFDLASETANLDNAKAGVALAEANYQTQLAVIRQLQELVGYEIVTAPFDGVVTERNVDTGDLINPTGTSVPMFVVQSDDTLRVRVDVPQADSVGLHDGLEAQVALPERPDVIFKGVVARNALAFNPNSRTLPIEVDVKNDAHLLMPGQFVNVTILVPRTTPAVVVPAGAILFNSNGLRVATVDGNNVVHMRDVTIYRDFGTSIELRSGISGGERVAINPPANLSDGASVKISDTANGKSGTGRIATN